MIRRPPRSTRTDTLFPYTTLFRSGRAAYVRQTATRRPKEMGSNMAFALDASRPRATHDGHAPVRWIPAWTDVQMDDAGIGPLPLEHRAWVRDRAMRWRSTPPPSPMRGGGPWHCISVRYSEQIGRASCRER